MREPAAATLLADLVAAGSPAVALTPADLADDVTLGSLRVLVIEADPAVLTAAVLGVCDRAAVRIVPFITDERSARFAASLGLPPVSDPTAASVRAASERAPEPVRRRSPARVIAVWGPHGAPGRTSLAVSIADELCRGGREACLIDADSHAPALAQSLGLSDDAPGLAGACRQVARGRFDEAEFRRIRAAVPQAEAGLSLLTGINRPSRWPELRGDLVTRVITGVRGWTDHVVVDTAASLEQDEQLVSDVDDDGLRRNAATLAALGAADHVVAVVAAEPVGMARFVRAMEELRAAAPGATVTVVANRVRAGAIGFDAKSQIRATLARLGGIDEVMFLPEDRTAHDRATLRAGIVARVAPRSPYAAAVRRLAAELVR